MNLNLRDIVFVRDDGDHSTKWGHPLMNAGRFAFGILREYYEELKANGAFDPKINTTIAANWYTVTPTEDATIYSDDYREICRWIYGYDQVTTRALHKAKTRLAEQLWPEMTLKIRGNTQELDYSDLAVSTAVFNHPEYQKLHNEYLRVRTDKYEGDALLKKLEDVSDIRIEDPNNISQDRIIMDYFPLLTSDRLIDILEDLPPGEFVISDYEINPVYP